MTAGTTRVALLRGINVGKAKRVAMADLRGLLGTLGYGEPRTLLNSGNAIFVATGTDAAIAKKIEAGIDSELGLEVRVVVRSATDLAKVLEANPFVAEAVDPKHLAVAFLGSEPTAAGWEQLEPDGYLPDRWARGKQVVYLLQPNGVIATKLPDLERRLGVTVTARNWATAGKLVALATT
jgi:uncharacterized protein (DUF1697 family)